MDSISKAGPSTPQAYGGHARFSQGALTGHPAANVYVKQNDWQKVPEGTEPSVSNRKLYDTEHRNTEQQAGHLYASDEGNKFQGMMSLVWGFGAYCWEKIELYQGGQEAAPIQRIFSEDLVSDAVRQSFVRHVSHRPEIATKWHKIPKTETNTGIFLQIMPTLRGCQRSYSGICGWQHYSVK